MAQYATVEFEPAAASARWPDCGVTTRKREQRCDIAHRASRDDAANTKKVCHIS